LFIIHSIALIRNHRIEFITCTFQMILCTASLLLSTKPSLK